MGRYFLKTAELSVFFVLVLMNGVVRAESQRGRDIGPLLSTPMENLSPEASESSFHVLASSSKKKTVTVSGTWKINLLLKKNTCLVSPARSSFTAKIKIDAKLTGTDLFDNSPLFSGKMVSKDTIQFRRSGSFDNGCKVLQTLTIDHIDDKKKNSGNGVLDSFTQCGSTSCMTSFRGSAQRN